MSNFSLESLSQDLEGLFSDLSFQRGGSDPYPYHYCYYRGVKVEIKYKYNKTTPPFRITFGYGTDSAILQPWFEQLGPERFIAANQLRAKDERLAALDIDTEDYETYISIWKEVIGLIEESRPPEKVITKNRGLDFTGTNLANHSEREFMVYLLTRQRLGHGLIPYLGKQDLVFEDKLPGRRIDARGYLNGKNVAIECNSNIQNGSYLDADHERRGLVIYPRLLGGHEGVSLIVLIAGGFDEDALFAAQNSSIPVVLLQTRLDLDNEVGLETVFDSYNAY